MKEIKIGTNEAGQRLDKLLGKVLNQAPSGFLYKMLRKKNIKLNQKKADGKELLQAGDCVQIYLSDDTFAKFHQERQDSYAGMHDKRLNPRNILYQDANIMILNKPAGVLSQKAKPEDDSINEQMLRYLIAKGTLTQEQIATFTPSVCNRLDRNTSGIVLAGISLVGSQELSRMLRERSLDKYYLALVSGKMTKPMQVTAYLTKDETTNRVTVTEHEVPMASRIETHYTPLHYNEDYTLLEVKLITGKTHQIRAHLAYLGYPILGDAKYGNRVANQSFRTSFGIQNQFLHAYRVVFPYIQGDLKAVSGMECVAPLPRKLHQAVETIWKDRNLGIQ